jgi:hypothetical protein
MTHIVSIFIENVRAQDPTLRASPRDRSSNSTAIRHLPSLETTASVVIRDTDPRVVSSSLCGYRQTIMHRVPTTSSAPRVKDQGRDRDINLLETANTLSLPPSLERNLSTSDGTKLEGGKTLWCHMSCARLEIDSFSLSLAIFLRDPSHAQTSRLGQHHESLVTRGLVASHSVDSIHSSRRTRPPRRIAAHGASASNLLVGGAAPVFRNWFVGQQPSPHVAASTVPSSSSRAANGATGQDASRHASSQPPAAAAAPPPAAAAALGRAATPTTTGVECGRHAAMPCDCGITTRSSHESCSSLAASFGSSPRKSSI